jgi:fused signal recognition particle receptor
VFSLSWSERLKLGLSKTREQLTRVFRRTQLDESTYEALEEALLLTDMGITATQTLLQALAQQVRQTGDVSLQSAQTFLVNQLHQQMQVLEKTWVFQTQTPTVVMVCGVNGAGKTSSLGKLAYQWHKQGRRVLLAAGDTFRAGACEQLAAWAQRSGAGLVRPQGSDSAALAFSAVQQAMRESWDVVLIDTAGRLATQAHLMQEMQKIKRVIAKALPGAPHETILVLDGHTGQNGLAQVQAFHEALHLSGVIMTKLDGTAKGGVLLALSHHKPLPVYGIGVGEQMDDLHPFDAKAFAQALIGDSFETSLASSTQEFATST